MIHQNSSLSPPINPTEVVLAADGGPEAELDEEELRDLFSEEATAPLLQPSGDDHGHADDADAEVRDGAGEEQAAEEDLQGAEHKLLPDPGEPTAAMVEDHRACGHIPYRSWCTECVEARGLGEPHRARPEPRQVCVFAFDYLFIGKDGVQIRREELTDGRKEVDV